MDFSFCLFNDFGRCSLCGLSQQMSLGFVQAAHSYLVRLLAVENFFNVNILILFLIYLPPGDQISDRFFIRNISVIVRLSIFGCFLALIAVVSVAYNYKQENVHAAH